MYVYIHSFPYTLTVLQVQQAYRVNVMVLEGPLLVVLVLTLNQPSYKLNRPLDRQLDILQF